MRTARGPIAVMVVALVALAGFVMATRTHHDTGTAGGASPSTPSSTSNRSAPSAASTTNSRSPASTGPSVDTGTVLPGNDVETGSSSPATASATSDRVRDAAAVGQAQQFLALYARPSGGPALYSWWDTITPYLAPEAMHRLHVKAQDVPFTKLTGTAWLVGHTDSGDVRVKVPTNKGVWVVTMTSRHTTDQMLVVSASPQKTAKPAKAKASSASKKSPKPAKKSSKK